MPHTLDMVTRAEQVVGSVVVPVLLAGLLSAVTAPRVVSPRGAPAIQRIALPPEPVEQAGSAARAAAPSAKPSPAIAPARPVTTAVAPTPPLTGCPAPRRPPPNGGPRGLGPPIVAESHLPTPVAVRGKARGLAAVRGKGLWVTPFGSTRVDVRALVRQALGTGVHSLWIRTGGTRQGYYGDRFLPQLVPAAHAAGLAVVAWDFPFLSNPMADVLRAKQALAAGVDAFSPDVETAAEGTYLTARRVALYLSAVRRYAGARPVVATVPRPSDQRATFPYRSFVPYADVFAPMVYWSCNEPGALVQESLLRLGRLLPVAPIGQGYDMGPEGGRAGTPSRLETLRFLDAARRGGALGASLWTVEEAGPAQLQALADYRWPLMRQ